MLHAQAVSIFFAILYTFSMAAINVAIKLCSLSTFSIMFARYNIALLISLPIIYFLIPRKCSIYLHLLRGGFLFAGHYCVYQGFKHANFLTGTLMSMTEPLVVILISYIVFKRKHTFIDLFYLAIGFTGATLLIFATPAAQGKVEIIGIMYLLLSNFIAAAGVFICKEISDKEHWSVTVFYTTSILWCFGWLIFPYTNYTSIISNSITITRDFYLLLIIGVLAFTTHYTIARSLAVMKPEVFASFQYLRLVFGLIFSLILLNQYPNYIQIIGATLIVFGIYMLQQSRLKQLLIKQ